MSVIEARKANFEEEVLKADKPVLVDFWASWCGPCRMLSPIVDTVAEKYPEIKVAKVNVDEENELANKYRVSGIPSLLLFKDGEVAKRSVGVVPLEDIVAMFRD